MLASYRAQVWLCVLVPTCSGFTYLTGNLVGDCYMGNKNPPQGTYTKAYEGCSESIPYCAVSFKKRREKKCILGRLLTTYLPA